MPDDTRASQSLPPLPNAVISTSLPTLPAKDYPMKAVTGANGTEWANNLFGVNDSTWTLAGKFLPDEQCVESEPDSPGADLQSVKVYVATADRTLKSPMKVISYVCVSGPGAELVDVAVWPQAKKPDNPEPSSTYINWGETKYQGWQGSSFSQGPAVKDAAGNYWYRLEIDWSYTDDNPSGYVFFAKTYRDTSKGGDPTFKLWAYTEPIKAKYAVEMLGRRGELEFAALLDSKPTTAKLKLYGLTTNDVKTFDLTNGSWNENIFKADITGDAIEGISISKPAIKMKFTQGRYPLIGLISSKGYIDSESWMAGVMTLVIGHEWESGKGLLPDGNLPRATTTATVVFDRHAEPDRNKPSRYAYGWWSDPSTKTTPTFTALTLVWDDLQKELALYQFNNDDTLSNDPAALNKYKVHAYNFEEINRHLQDFVPKYFHRKVPFRDLTALLLNVAMRTVPSKMFGISSGGHGYPEGIMNDILDDGKAIRGCFTWVTGLRGNTPIDFFDFGTNCNVASLHNMEAVSPYAKYVLASDLTRNSPRPSIGKRPSDTYHSYFDDPTKDAKTILKEMMDAYAITWNDSDAEAFYQSPDALKSGNTLSGWKQQLTLFDCSRFAPILKAIGGIERFKEQLKQIPNDNPHVYYEESGRRLADFKSAAELVLPQPTEFEAMWRRFAIAKVDNRQGLVWDSDAPSGMLVK